MSSPSTEPMRAEPCAKRIRAYLAGDLVVDTVRALLVWDGWYYPAYHLPVEDLRAALVPTGEMVESRGIEFEIVDVETERGRAPRAGRRHVASPLEQLRDTVRLKWSAMDEWLEEDEPVYTHARDPYARIDVLASSRHVRIEIDGVTVAESRAPRILFETGLPPRYYLPLSDVRMDLLQPTSTRSQCPYKGTAGYWSVEIGEKIYDDLVWIYRAPLPESQKIAGMACFYNERVDLFIDGVAVERPRTHFSA